MENNNSIMVLERGQELRVIHRETGECDYCKTTNNKESQRCSGCGAEFRLDPLYIIEA